MVLICIVHIPEPTITYVYLFCQLTIWMSHGCVWASFLLEYKIVLVFECIVIINLFFLELFTLMCGIFFPVEVTLAIWQVHFVFHHQEVDQVYL